MKIKIFNRQVCAWQPKLADLERSMSMNMHEIILSAENLSKVFKVQEKENAVLDHVNVELYKNDFTVIMGPSGTGKSTLL